MTVESVQEVYLSGDRLIEGVAEAEGLLTEAPSASATAFRVVSHIRWHGEVLRDTSRIRLFVGVLTGGANADRRAAVRETWGKDKRLHRYRPSTCTLIEGIAATSKHCQCMMARPTA